MMVGLLDVAVSPFDGEAPLLSGLWSPLSRACIEVRSGDWFCSFLLDGECNLLVKFLDRTFLLTTCFFCVDTFILFYISKGYRVLGSSTFSYSLGLSPIESSGDGSLSSLALFDC